MISIKTLELYWLKTISYENKNADIILVEKVVRALILLEGLAKSNLEFVFKGGTALMLLLDSAKRLSIDIDIVIKNNEILQIKHIFENYLKDFDFTRFELIKRNTFSKIQKSHYKFYYYPIHKISNSEDFILLDVLVENETYNNTLDFHLNSKFLIQEDKPLIIKIPTFENLLGDKLTAFAPNTTGIPYLKNGFSKSMDIIKQLYDIGCLFDKVENINEIRTTFNTFSKIEMDYRDLNITTNDILDDIFQTALCITLRGKDGICNFELLNKGISSISSYIFSESYHIEKAITDCSKAAYLSILIKNKSEEIEKFSNPLEIKDWLIESPMNTKLNKLKKTNPKAFFYWYKISKFSVS